MKISRSVVPTGEGWPYIENGRKILGGTFDELVKNLTNDRIANQVNLGNPEQDIEAQLCERFPANCFASGPELPSPPSKARTFRERVTAWAANRYSKAGAITLVEQDEADRRAAICQECPANQNWKTHCQPCIESTERTLLLIRQNRKPSLAVLGCAIAGHDNTAACVLPEDALRHRNKYLTELTPQCWMREL